MVSNVERYTIIPVVLPTAPSSGPKRRPSRKAVLVAWVSRLVDHHATARLSHSAIGGYCSPVDARAAVRRRSTDRAPPPHHRAAAATAAVAMGAQKPPYLLSLMPNRVCRIVQSSSLRRVFRRRRVCMLANGSLLNRNAPPPATTGGVLVLPCIQAFGVFLMLRQFRFHLYVVRARGRESARPRGAWHRLHARQIGVVVPVATTDDAMWSEAARRRGSFHTQAVCATFSNSLSQGHSVNIFAWVLPASGLEGGL